MEQKANKKGKGRVGQREGERGRKREVYGRERKRERG
jgi:hypothetical protein